MLEKFDLSEKYVFTEVGNYSFVGSGPIIVVGGWHNRCSPGKIARDQIHPKGDRQYIHVYTIPGDILFYKYEEYDDAWL